MAELLASASSKVRGLFSGQKINGVVSAKTPRSLILDIGGKSEGMVAEKAFIEARDFIKTLKIGDTVTATHLILPGKDWKRPSKGKWLLPFSVRGLTLPELRLISTG